MNSILDTVYSLDCGFFKRNLFVQMLPLCELRCLFVDCQRCSQSVLRMWETFSSPDRGHFHPAPNPQQTK